MLVLYSKEYLERKEQKVMSRLMELYGQEKVMRPYVESEKIANSFVTKAALNFCFDTHNQNTRNIINPSTFSIIQSVP